MKIEIQWFEKTANEESETNRMDWTDDKIQHRHVDSVTKGWGTAKDHENTNQHSSEWDT